MADLIDRAQTSAEMVKHAKGTTVIGGQTFRTIKLEDALDAIAALPAQGVIPRRLVPELIAWAKDEQQNWPMETAYQDDLAAFLAALARAEAGGVEACRCGSDVTDMDGHIVHDDDCPESWQSQATIRKSQTVAPAPVDALVKAAGELKEIVEGITGAMEHGAWRDEKGMRLKDTPEWVAFYNALAAIRETRT